MNKMIANGFGCAAFVLLCSFHFPVTNGLGNELKQLQKSDTIIASTSPNSGIIVADAGKIPSAESIVILAKEKEAAKNINLNKTITLREKMFKELHPMSIAFVQSYQQKNEKKLDKIKIKYATQFDFIDNVLLKYELPTNLKYLAVIESELSNSAISHKGAVGPWQFMASTGRLMGLTINHNRDDRRNLVKSTEAAAKYLKSLYGYFNDWLLVIAAYNGGASRVDYAIKKSHSTDFWKLQYYLPAESRMHVKRFIATQYVLEATDDIIPLLNIKKLSEEDLANTTVININGKYVAEVIAKYLEMDEATFNTYNPYFNLKVVVSGYDMRIPKDKIELFSKKRKEILKESVQAMINEKKEIIAPESSSNNYPDAISLPKSKAAQADEAGRNSKKKIL
ncbi:MAG: lytic transglycosylase domain-containing protein [Bacteroidetes bacterium]|nr:lytic transglycosylase domain-containing protein [Bacteroidota bacterium]